ncbi:MAG: hypothetical protein JXA99_16275 [Candidatus Lokiarchaeota archaeon]|nr:hypothetical protein [Candidatus Lokiarchaeota archaeon]
MTSSLINKNRKAPLINNNMLFVIPSWSKVLGFPTLGTYANQDITKILTDIVIFFGGTESSIVTDKGIIHCLFGLGYYFTKFELKSGRYIIDSRQLSGLILSDFVYDHLASSKRITLQDDEDVIYSERVVKVPIDLSFKSNNKQTFIKGALMRNLFIPYKESILEMMSTIKKPDTYDIKNNGHMILSTHWDYYNKILISSKGNYAKYINPTAGINEIIIGVDDFLSELFSSSKMSDIDKMIFQLKNVYSIIDYDPMYLSSILEKTAQYLKGPGKLIIDKKKSDKNINLKNSLFISAESRLNEVSPWPTGIRRRDKPEIISTDTNNNNNNQQVIDNSRSNIYNIEGYNTPKNDDFVLKTMRSEFVKSRSLPQMPTNSIKDILFYLRSIINDNYDMPTIGSAIEIARDNLRKLVLHLDYMWEMSKLANIYKKKNPNLSLSQKDRYELLEKVESWINNANKNMIRLNP